MTVPAHEPDRRVATTLSRGDLWRLRDAFLAAGYTSDGVLDLLGTSAHNALARLETVPARRRTRGGSPLETLVRLFLLQLPVDSEHARRALPLELAEAGGIVVRDVDTVTAAVDIRPHASDAGADFYVASDLATGLDGKRRAASADYVLGIGGASTTLAQLTVRDPVASALDVGTGSAVQALHLAQHAGRVTATDVLPRALDFARLSADLSEVELDLRAGSLFEPVADERFDLVVSNPPFVVGPGDGGRFTYRDSGFAGDEVCARLVREAPGHLTDGGWCQLLANWVHRSGEDWQERVAGWLPADCDAWVVQREVEDPAEYVAMWLRDSGDDAAPDYVERYDAWLGAFEEQGIEGVGFGLVTLRRTGGSAHRIEDWPHAVEQPLGPAVLEHFARVAWLRDADLASARLVVADDVTQETFGEPGAEDPNAIVLRSRRGMLRAETVGTATAALVGACDGELPVGVLVDAVASVLEVDAAGLAAQVLPDVRRLVELGLLEPAD